MQLTATIHVGGSPQAATFVGGRVWVSVDAPTIAGSETAPAGGTARLEPQADVDYDGIAHKGAKTTLAPGKAHKRRSASCSVTASNAVGTITTWSARLRVR